MCWRFTSAHRPCKADITLASCTPSLQQVCISWCCFLSKTFFFHGALRPHEVEVCTETVGLLGTEAQDVHLDFHTAPDLWSTSTETHKAYGDGEPRTAISTFTQLLGSDTLLGIKISKIGDLQKGSKERCLLRQNTDKWLSFPSHFIVFRRLTA